LTPLRAAWRRLRALQQEARQLQGCCVQLDTTLQHARSALNHLATQYAIDDEDW
jgi:hypothetical protein